MAPWNQPRPRHLSWKEILQMEREKVANEATEELMNQVKEMLEEHAYEESFQEDPDEAYHVEDSEEAFNEDEVLSLNDPDEDIQAAIPPTHQEENTMSYDPFEDLDDSLFHDPGSEGALEEPSIQLINILTLSYRLENVDGTWAFSPLTEIPLTTLRVALKQRIGLRAYMTQMFGMVMVT
jgi:hypothetical protein